jgi:hypothetical protein
MCHGGYNSFKSELVTVRTVGSQTCADIGTGLHVLVRNGLENELNATHKAHRNRAKELIRILHHAFQTETGGQNGYFT